MTTPDPSLREQLAAIGLVCACDAAWTERHLHAPDCLQDVGDDAVDAVAAWLRSDESRELAALAVARYPHARFDAGDAANIGDAVIAALADSLEGR